MSYGNLTLNYQVEKEAIDLYEVNKQMEHKVYEELKDFLLFLSREERKILQWPFRKI